MPRARCRLAVGLGGEYSAMVLAVVALAPGVGSSNGTCVSVTTHPCSLFAAPPPPPCSSLQLRSHVHQCNALVACDGQNRIAGVADGHRAQNGTPAAGEGGRFAYVDATAQAWGDVLVSHEDVVLCGCGHSGSKHARVGVVRRIPAPLPVR